MESMYIWYRGRERDELDNDWRKGSILVVEMMSVLDGSIQRSPSFVTILRRSGRYILCQRPKDEGRGEGGREEDENGEMEGEGREEEGGKLNAPSSCPSPSRSSPCVDLERGLEGRVLSKFGSC